MLFLEIIKLKLLTDEDLCFIKAHINYGLRNCHTLIFLELLKLSEDKKLHRCIAVS
jgi:hypothetical protein